MVSLTMTKRISFVASQNLIFTNGDSATSNTVLLAQLHIAITTQLDNMIST